MAFFVLLPFILILLFLASNLARNRDGEVLIEGVFDREEKSSELFSSKSLIVFWFDNQCRECWEEECGGKSRPVLYDQCHACVPANVRGYGDIKPEKGDSIKVIIWKNIFGRVIGYKFVRTNFAEQFGQSQLAKEEQEWAAYHDAFERREAMCRGLSVEEYKRVKREEDIQYVVEHIGLKADDVVAHEYHTMPRSVLWTLKGIIDKTGRMPSKKEVYEEEGKQTRELLKRIHATPLKDLNLKCYDIGHEDRCEYVETGTFSDIEKVNHLSECQTCYELMDKMRVNFVNFQKTPECLTDDDKTLSCDSSYIRVTGMVPTGKEEHVKNCWRCYFVYERRKAEHLKDPSKPTCLKHTELVSVQAGNNLSEGSSKHIEHCLRCKNLYKKNRDIYIDSVIPMPQRPITRMKSIRKELQAGQPVN